MLFNAILALLFLVALQSNSTHFPPHPFLMSDKASEFVQSWMARPTADTHIAIRDPQLLSTKISTILSDGRQQLHVISDFDMTMTKYWVNGTRGPSTHACLQHSSVVSANFKSTADTMYRKYYPKEIDPQLSHPVKFKYMEQWWREAHDAVIVEGIREQDLVSMVKETPMTWRAGIKQLLELTHELDIYFLILSAGIKNLIKHILLHDGLLYPHVHVESNEMFFDPVTGKCIRFSEPPIHTMNKAEKVLAAPDLPPESQEARHYQAIKNRMNVILLGDNISDATMADGVPHNTCLRVGFCNVSPESWLDKYKDAFDVVVLDDVGFDWVIQLVQLLK